MCAFMMVFTETATLIEALADCMLKEVQADHCRSACCVWYVKAGCCAYHSLAAFKQVACTLNLQARLWDITGTMHRRGAAHPPLHP